MPWAPTRVVRNDAFYTRREVVDAAIDAIEARAPVEAHDTIVDVACGDNYFATALRARVERRTRRQVPIVAYDVEPRAPLAPETVRRADFRRVRRADHAGLAGADVVLGFNLPFGRSGALLRELVAHALVVFERPRVLYLVHPRRTYTPDGYAIVYQRPLARYSFYVPTTRRSFGAPACFFSIMMRVPTSAGWAGQRLAYRSARTANVTFTTVSAAASLAVLRVGARAGRVVVALDDAGAFDSLFVDGQRQRGDVDTTTDMYIKVAFDAGLERRRLLAAQLSRVAGTDPRRNDSSPPSVTREFIERALEWLLAADRPRAFFGDIRSYAVPVALDVSLACVDDSFCCDAPSESSARQMCERAPSFDTAKRAKRTHHIDERAPRFDVVESTNDRTQTRQTAIVERAPCLPPIECAVFQCNNDERAPRFDE